MGVVSVLRARRTETAHSSPGRRVRLWIIATRDPTPPTVLWPRSARCSTPGIPSASSLGPQDEYDCLIAPILDRLAAGDGADEIAAFLRRELDEHFGLDPDRHAAGIENVALEAVGLRDRR